MKPAKCGYYELEMVEDLLGKLPGERSDALQVHLDGCKRCRAIYDEWQKILVEDEVAMPSPRLYQRLKNNYHRRYLKGLVRRPQFVWAVGVAAVLTIALLVFLQFKKPFNSWEQMWAAGGSMPYFVVNDRETVQYPVGPQKGELSDLEGLIWVNDSRDEVYFYFQGLDCRVDRDYQIWLIKPVVVENGGLLKVTDRRGASLHLQQRNIREVRQISISLEPKGGSFSPTGDDVVLVDFKPYP